MKYKCGTCVYENRVSIHPSIKIGGFISSKCSNKTLPGMTLCYEHADRDAMAYFIRSLVKEVEALKEKLND